ncbi:Uncharacterised protein [Enterobacter cloacae]|nr:Uncharacterised protein [Enterobacter cloacae]
MKKPISTGTRVIPSPAATAIDQVLVNASGENILPSCASSEKTGINDSVMINRLQNSAGPTSTAAFSARRQYSPGAGSLPGLSCRHCSSTLCMFSIITIAASTIAPMAMAIPPSDIIFALMP